MAFIVVSWNVEHFDGGVDQRAIGVANHIQQFNPDLIAIYELESEHGGWNFARRFFPGFFTFITEGQNLQELMILANPASFDHVTITQRHRFRLRNPFLRPGALATVSQNDVHTNLLFLHSASGTLGDAFGDRVEIAERFFNLNKTLQKLEADGGPPARLVICGDLNTMGLQYPRGIQADRHLTDAQELAGLAELAGRAHRTNFVGMTVAPKEFDVTFSNANNRQASGLDHVMVSHGLQLTNQGNRPLDGQPFEVMVRGWQQLPTQAQRNQFINTMSDHNALVFEVV
jgi:exonuclease III